MKRALLVLLVSCAPAMKPHDVPMPVQAASIDGMKTSVAPGDDFFMYANGGWYDRTEIPRDRSTWGVNEELEERTDAQTKELIQKAGSDASPDAKKIATYYAAYMDEGAIEAKGLTPLDASLAEIAAINDKRGLAKALGARIRADVDVLNTADVDTPHVLGVWIAEDLVDPKQYATFLVQGGLGMPDRDYYLDASPRMTEIRAKYVAHIEKVLTLAKASEPKAKAQKIFELEKKIAESHVAREDVSDAEKGNNRWQRKDFDKNAPGMDWTAFLSAARLEQRKDFIVWTPKATTGLAALVQKEPLDTWKAYLQFHEIDEWGWFLPKAFVQETFEFHGKTLHGSEQLRERWKYAVDATNDALGESVGKLYVAAHFSPAEKARAQAMVKNVIAAFGKRIDRLDWMSAETKAKAKAKLATLEVEVGYPDTWRDYSALSVVPGEALANARRVSMFEYERNLAKLGKPVDRKEWVMNAQLVNAVNLPVRNAVQIPAAQLQPPFFDPNRPSAMDYAATGGTIGHEISHSFDDQGALFDETGKMTNWWTPEDLAHFKASGAALAAQYDKYKPLPDLAVNGKQTLGENIADVAGLAVAYDGYRASLDGPSDPGKNGLTGDQLFFIAWAQSWSSKMRPEALRSQLVGNGHAPAEYRADCVRNLDAWYGAFAPTPGQKLFLEPKDRVRVW